MQAYTHRLRPFRVPVRLTIDYPLLATISTLAVLFHCRCVTLTARRTALLVSLLFAVLQAIDPYYYHYFSVSLNIWSTSSDDLWSYQCVTKARLRSAALRVLCFNQDRFLSESSCCISRLSHRSSLCPSVSSLLAPVTLTPGVSVFGRPLPVSRAGTSSLICWSLSN